MTSSCATPWLGRGANCRRWFWRSRVPPCTHVASTSTTPPASATSYAIMCKHQPANTMTTTDSDLPRWLARVLAYNHQIKQGYKYHVAFREILHWLSFRSEATSTGMILAFCTITKTLRLVARPPCNNRSTVLLELEGELCAVAFEDATLFNIWVLQDYESNRWMLRNQVQVVVKP
jgi:hypothetical protein